MSVHVACTGLPAPLWGTASTHYPPHWLWGASLGSCRWLRPPGMERRGQDIVWGLVSPAPEGPHPQWHAASAVPKLTASHQPCHSLWVLSPSPPPFSPITSRQGSNQSGQALGSGYQCGRGRKGWTVAYFVGPSFRVTFDRWHWNVRGIGCTS